MTDNQAAKGARVQATDRGDRGKGRTGRVMKPTAAWRQHN